MNSEKEHRQRWRCGEADAPDEVVDHSCYAQMNVLQHRLQ